jgi:hypothetical protein
MTNKDNIIQKFPQKSVIDESHYHHAQDLSIYNNEYKRLEILEFLNYLALKDIRLYKDLKRSFGLVDKVETDTIMSEINKFLFAKNKT